MSLFRPEQSTVITALLTESAYESTRAQRTANRRYQQSQTRTAKATRALLITLALQILVVVTAANYGWFAVGTTVQPLTALLFLPTMVAVFVLPFVYLRFKQAAYTTLIITVISALVYAALAVGSQQFGQFLASITA